MLTGPNSEESQLSRFSGLNKGKICNSSAFNKNYWPKIAKIAHIKRLNRNQLKSEKD